jgi:glutathione peroxidase
MFDQRRTSPAVSPGPVPVRGKLFAGGAVAVVMTIYDVPLRTLDGAVTSLGEYAGKAILAVNVASRCGLTPQYAGLERLQERYADRGFTVVGFPCNQFGGQEPGSAAEISTFCSTTYGVTFPMMEKIDVNGDDRHPLYRELVETADPEGQTGDIQWNFEKFLIDPSGAVVGRFRPRTEPEDASVTAAIEAVLPV